MFLEPGIGTGVSIQWLLKILAFELTVCKVIGT